MTALSTNPNMVVSNDPGQAICCCRACARAQPHGRLFSLTLDVWLMYRGLSLALPCEGLFFDSFLAEAPFGAGGQAADVPLVVRRHCWHTLRAIASRHPAPPGAHANRLKQQRNPCSQR